MTRTTILVSCLLLACTTFAESPKTSKDKISEKDNFFRENVTKIFLDSVASDSLEKGMGEIFLDDMSSRFSGDFEAVTQAQLAKEAVDLKNINAANSVLLICMSRTGKVNLQQTITAKNKLPPESRYDFLRLFAADSISAMHPEYAQETLLTYADYLEKHPDPSGFSLVYEMMNAKNRSDSRRWSWSELHQLAEKRKLDDAFIKLIESEAEFEKSEKKESSTLFGFSNKRSPSECQEYLKKALKLAAEAAETRPDLIEAWIQIIEINARLDAPDLKQSRNAFEKATAICFDEQPLYDSMAELMAKTGNLRQFAEDCLNTGKFDTDTPFFYMNILMLELDRLPQQEQQKILRSRPVREALLKLLAGTPADDMSHKYQLIHMLINAGEYGKAAETYAASDESGFLKAPRQEYLRTGPSRQEIQNIIELFSGPWKEELLKWETARLSDMTPDEFRQTTANLALKLKKDGNIEAVKFVLTYGYPVYGASMNIQEIKSTTPPRIREPLLLKAIIGNDAGLTSFLLDSGWPADEQHPLSGESALMLASAGNKIPILQVLLEKGANPNLLTNNGKTALHSAVIRDNADAVRLLLKAGADMNLSKPPGMSAKSLAIQMKKKELSNIFEEWNQTHE